MGLYKFLPWVDPERINWKYLSGNENAIWVLEDNMERVDWGYLSTNPSAMHILTKNLDKVSWNDLSMNPSAMCILNKNLDRINWEQLAHNPEAIELLSTNMDKSSIKLSPYLRGEFATLAETRNRLIAEGAALRKSLNEATIVHQAMRLAMENGVPYVPEIIVVDDNPIPEPDIENRVFWTLISGNRNAYPILAKNLDKIDWGYFSKNPMSNAVELLEKNLDKADWHFLSKNAGAIDILEKHMDKVVWSYLSQNIGAKAIRMLEMNLEKVDWSQLSSNKNATHMLKSRPDKIDWEMLCWNSSLDAIELLTNNADKVNWDTIASNFGIFELDLTFLKTRMDLIREELMMTVFHPKRVMRHFDVYGYSILEDVYEFYMYK